MPYRDNIDSPSEAEIQSLLINWGKKLETLDPNQVADLYSEDAIILPTISNRVRTNRAEYIDYFELFLKLQPKMQVISSHVSVLSPITAVDSGQYRFDLIRDGVPEVQDARYTFVYEKQGDTWMIISQHSSFLPEKL